MDPKPKSEYSEETVAQLEGQAKTMHEEIKGIANAWVTEWIGDAEAASSEQVMAKVDPENMKNAAGLMLAICTCVDAGLIQSLRTILNQVVGAKIKADYAIEPKAQRSMPDGDGGG
jgi:hypothetical protein